MNGKYPIVAGGVVENGGEKEAGGVVDTDGVVPTEGLSPGPMGGGLHGYGHTWDVVIMG